MKHICTFLFFCCLNILAANSQKQILRDSLLADFRYLAVYQPAHVYVLTDADTFSAAFHYTFYLWKMGATVVVPRCGLQGSISNSLQLFLPPQDPRAKTFYPDRMPDYEDYRKYNFDAHTEVLYLLDKIMTGQISKVI